MSWVLDIGHLRAGYFLVQVLGFCGFRLKSLAEEFQGPGFRVHGLFKVGRSALSVDPM